MKYIPPPTFYKTFIFYTYYVVVHSCLWKFSYSSCLLMGRRDYITFMSYLCHVCCQFFVSIYFTSFFCHLSVSYRRSLLSSNGCSFCESGENPIFDVLAVIALLLCYTVWTRHRMLVLDFFVTTLLAFFFIFYLLIPMIRYWSR